MQYKFTYRKKEMSNVPVTDLRIGQIGHDLRPRVFGAELTLLQYRRLYSKIKRS